MCSVLSAAKPQQLKDNWTGGQRKAEGRFEKTLKIYKFEIDFFLRDLRNLCSPEECVAWDDAAKVLKVFGRQMHLPALFHLLWELGAPLKHVLVEMLEVCF